MRLRSSHGTGGMRTETLPNSTNSYKQLGAWIFGESGWLDVGAEFIGPAVGSGELVLNQANSERYFSVGA